MTGIFGDIAVLLGGLVAGVLAILGYGQVQKRKGRKDAEDDFTEADRAEADAIRDRIERERADSLHKYEDSGYRDQ